MLCNTKEIVLWRLFARSRIGIIKNCRRSPSRLNVQIHSGTNIMGLKITSSAESNYPPLLPLLDRPMGAHHYFFQSKPRAQGPPSIVEIAGHGQHWSQKIFHWHRLSSVAKKPTCRKEIFSTFFVKYESIHAWGNSSRLVLFGEAFAIILSNYSELTQDWLTDFWFS